MKSTKSMCRQLCFHLYPPAPFAFGALFLLFHFTYLSHSTRRGATTHFPLEVHSLRHRVRALVPLCSLHQVQIALILSQILTFSHARSTPCLVAFSPGHSVLGHSAKLPNKINAQLNASVDRASFESSIALGAKSCC